MTDAITSPPSYHVNVSREGRWWLANFPSVAGAHTHAKSLAALTRTVREAIVLMDDLPLDARERIELELHVHSGERLAGAKITPGSRVSLRRGGESE
jgi:predicted RNase H-like HicB family nuclease